MRGARRIRSTSCLCLLLLTVHSAANMFLVSVLSVEEYILHDADTAASVYVTSIRHAV